MLVLETAAVVPLLLIVAVAAIVVFVFFAFLGLTLLRLLDRMFPPES